VRVISVTAIRRVCSVVICGAVLSGVNAQVPRVRERIGVPQDWSHYRLVVHGDVAKQHPELAAKEPRFNHAFLQQVRARNWSGTLAVSNARTDLAPAAEQQRDWSVPLGTSARVATGMFPAKYSFDIAAPPDCANDFVVFGILLAGVTGGQGNMIAFNNLYAGPLGLCGTAPSVMFSYNVTTATGGRVLTSPSLSQDGTKIAFVESTTTSSIFHVLKWAKGAGNGTSPTVSAKPGTGNTATLSSITYAAANNTRSSPWIDYANDTAYVGADNGRVYKFTGVFKGTPTLAGAPWPVLIKNNRRLTSPVFDRLTNNIFVGDASGGLYQYNVVTQALNRLDVSTPQQINANIIDTPLVDPFNGTVFATSSNDGTSAVLVEADTTSLAQLARVRIGQGSSGGTVVNLYDGAFSDSYFTSPGSGQMLVCGTGPADVTPWLYTLNFTGRVVNTAPVSQFQIRNSTRARCSPITEFFNPHLSGGTDYFFWGVSFDCNGANSSGCVMSRTGTGASDSLTEAGGTSGIVVDNISLAKEASSIYFTSQRLPFQAVKALQNGLN